MPPRRKPTRRKPIRSHVGMRSPAEILADPRALAEEIQALSEDSPIAALQHPNCPQDLWWSLADLFPAEAQGSLAGQLFLLEEPERWLDLEARLVPKWIKERIRRLSEADLRRFAVDCAAHALPVFEAMYPKEKRPRRAMEAARAFANNKIREKALDFAYRAAMEAAKVSERAIPFTGKASDSVPASVAHSAALAAARVAWIIDPNREPLVDPYEIALNVLSLSSGAAYVREGTGPAKEKAEKLWQWHRLCDYLR